MINKKVLLVLLFSSLCWETKEKELYEITPIGIICTVLEPKIVAKFTCKSKSLNRTAHIGYKEAIFRPGIELTSYHYHVQLYRKFATVYRPFMITLDEDLCVLFNNRNSPLGVALHLSESGKYGNFYDPCPISGRRYEKKYFNYSTWPELIPGGEYRFNTTYYTIIDGEKRDIMRSIYMGSVTPRTAIQWRK